MTTAIEHDTATCPDCNAILAYGMKEEATGWKVYYQCNDQCGFEQMAGWVKRSEIEHRDDVDKRAREMGERWAGS